MRGYSIPGEHIILNYFYKKERSEVLSLGHAAEQYIDQFFNPSQVNVGTFEGAPLAIRYEFEVTPT